MPGFVRPTPTTNPGPSGQGPGGQGFLDFLREKASGFDQAVKKIPGPHGVVFGDQDFDTFARYLLNPTGLAHAIALQGPHIGLGLIQGLRTPPLLLNRAQIDQLMRDLSTGETSDWS